MKRSDITFIVGAVFASLTALFYCSTMWFHLQVPRYYPLEHLWRWKEIKGSPSQSWYGMQGFAYLAAGGGALIVYLILKKTATKEVELSPGMTRLIGLAASLIVIVCMGYIFYHEFSKWGIIS